MNDDISSRVQQYPICTAIVLCDRVKFDSTTGRKTIKGTFDRLVAAKHEPISTRFHVYVELTDGLGTVPLEVQVVTTNKKTDGAEDILFSSKCVAKFPHQMKTTTAVFEVKVQFPEPGIYNCFLKSDDKIIIKKRIIINEKAK